MYFSSTDPAYHCFNFTEITLQMFIVKIHGLILPSFRVVTSSYANFRLHVHSHFSSLKTLHPLCWGLLDGVGSLVSRVIRSSSLVKFLYQVGEDTRISDIIFSRLYIFDFYFVWILTKATLHSCQCETVMNETGDCTISSPPWLRACFLTLTL